MVVDILPIITAQTPLGIPALCQSLGKAGQSWGLCCAVESRLASKPPPNLISNCVKRRLHPEKSRAFSPSWPRRQEPWLFQASSSPSRSSCHSIDTRASQGVDRGSLTARDRGARIPWPTRRPQPPRREPQHLDAPLAPSEPSWPRRLLRPESRPRTTFLPFDMARSSTVEGSTCHPCSSSLSG